jgi:formylglycine-generating enzyme required for sulfatase activity
VVNVTWQQASDFCAWRTERVKEWQLENAKKDEVPYYFAYRLPTYEEFQLMYDDIAELPDFIGEEGKRKDRGKVRYNQKREPSQYAEVADESSASADLTAPVKSYWPNSHEVYNIKGNVSEWLMEENTHAGGSWKTPFAADESLKLMTDKASPAIGFRCVCEAAASAP